MGIVDIRTGKPIAAPTFTRRKVLGGLAGILATGAAPAAFVRSAIGARTAAWGLPYDAEVEYLEGIGGPLIDTGILSTDDLCFEISASFSVDGTMYGSSTGAGSEYKTGWNRFQFGRRYAITGNKTCFWAFIADNSYSYYYCSANMENKIVFTLNTSDFYCGSTYAGKRYTDSLKRTSFGLFGLHSPTGTWSLYGGSKCYYAKFTRGGIIVGDFIPVRKQGVGYMYDKVSGKIFGNAGTGAFTVGPDV